MSCRGHPALRLTDRVGLDMFPAVILSNRSYHHNLTPPRRGISMNWSLLLMSFSCLSGTVFVREWKLARGSQTGRCEEKRLRKDARWRLEREKTAEIKGKKRAISRIFTGFCIYLTALISPFDLYSVSFSHNYKKGFVSTQGLYLNSDFCLNIIDHMVHTDTHTQPQPHEETHTEISTRNKCLGDLWKHEKSISTTHLTQRL